MMTLRIALKAQEHVELQQLLATSTTPTDPSEFARQAILTAIDDILRKKQAKKARETHG
jgi:hypothetical protein